MDDHAPSVRVEFSGQLHNASDLCSRLNLGKECQSNINELLIVGWRRWGTRLAEKLVGDYALGLHDESQKLTYLVRHPLGIKPLYYRLENSKLAYAFSIPELRQRWPSGYTKDLDWAAAYMLGLSFSQTRTAYHQIRKVPPGHWLTVDIDGNIRTERYHHWHDDAPRSTQRDEKWVDAYREVLEEAIRCRMDHEHPMATENSGGIDSATITAYLAHFLGEPENNLTSLSFALCQQEPEYILETSQACKIRHNYINTERYGLSSLEEMISIGLEALGQPEEHGNATNHIPFYQECVLRGIKSLHSGFGGDEVVTNPGRHLRWELLDQHNYSALWDIMPGNRLTRTLRTVKAAVSGRKKPGVHPKFIKALKKRWPHQLLNKETVERLGLQTRYLDTAVFDAPY